MEENGTETCRLSPNSSFVLISVPIRVEGEGERDEAIAEYRIGAFRGQGTALTLQAGLHTMLRFRVPQELFRDRERFSMEIRAGASDGPQTVLWTKRWDVAWRGEVPSLEPVADLFEEGADSLGGVPGPVGAARRNQSVTEGASP
ncbi:MAG: hypothetical protein ACYC6T_17730 [Thermoleophilia bacterium]